MTSKNIHSFLILKTPLNCKPTHPLPKKPKEHKIIQKIEKNLEKKKKDAKRRGKGENARGLRWLIMPFFLLLFFG